MQSRDIALRCPRHATAAQRGVHSRPGQRSFRPPLRGRGCFIAAALPMTQASSCALPNTRR